MDVHEDMHGRLDLDRRFLLQLAVECGSDTALIRAVLHAGSPFWSVTVLVRDRRREKPFAASMLAVACNQG
jgi:hypothetical protein